MYKHDTKYVSTSSENVNVFDKHGYVQDTVIEDENDFKLAMFLVHNDVDLWLSLHTFSSDEEILWRVTHKTEETEK